MQRAYHSFNQFLQDKFGCRVHRLSLDAGFSCPNLDASLSAEGCIFCSNKSFSHFTQDKKVSLEDQVAQAMEYARRRFKAEKFIAYFQSFSNTYADLDSLKKRYNIIKKFPDIVGISISTRPECVDEEKIDFIQTFTENYMVWVEYGLQSSQDEILNFLNRHHTFADFLKAVELTKDRNIYIGAHIILGIPGDDSPRTAKDIAGLGLNGVKFHCLHVVKNTKLHELYNQARIKLLEISQYVDIVCDFLELIPSGWVILRLVSDCSRRDLIAPLWMDDKQRVIRLIEEELLRRKSYQGKRWTYQSGL